MSVILGGVAIMLAAFLGGVSGFGFALLATPLLLVLGFPLPIVVPVNLMLGLVTRVSVAYRLRDHISWGRALTLLLGSLPGLYLGAAIVGSVQPSVLKVATGGVVVLVALLLLRSINAPPPAPVRGASLLAGFLGGLLGATTSLSGIPPALLLTRDKVSPITFQANMAVYLSLSSVLAITVLLIETDVTLSRVITLALLWLPGALLANLGGVLLTTRLPDRVFRYLTIGLAFTSGVITALSA